MIDEAEFINVQSHEYSLLNFSSALNIIYGRTHSGKSSIIRGMKWALENKPRGDEYRRDDTANDKNTAVSLSFKEGSYVSREKNPNTGLNQYLSSASDEPFKALRSDLPDEIKSITKIRPENIQSQGDRYFLLGKTSGQVATELNKVVGLKIIDDKLSKIKSIASGYSTRVKVLDSQIESVSEKIKADKFAIADGIKEAISDFESKVSDYNKKDIIIKDISEIIDLIESEERDSVYYAKIIKVCSDAQAIKKKVAFLKSKYSDLVEINVLASKIKYEQKRLGDANDIVALCDQLKPIKIEIAKAKSKYSELNDVMLLHVEIEAHEQIIEQAEDTIAECREIRSELERLVDYCTKCGSHRKHWSKK